MNKQLNAVSAERVKAEAALAAKLDIALAGELPDAAIAKITRCLDEYRKAHAVHWAKRQHGVQCPDLALAGAIIEPPGDAVLLGLPASR